MQHRPQILQSNHVANLLRDNLADLDHEELWGIFLRPDHTLITAEMLTKGTLNATLIDARTVLRHSLLNNAAKVIVVHTHPSGNPMPSQYDIDETRKVRAACLMLDIPLVDHVILADDSFYSFAEETRYSY